jgi:hypothetical protein
MEKRMGKLIDPTTRKVLEDLWMEEREDNPRVGEIQTCSFWPKGMTFPGFDTPWWVFRAAVENEGGRGEWIPAERSKITALTEQQVAPGWLFLKGLTPLWLKDSPYIALFDTFLAEDLAGIERIKFTRWGMGRAFTGAGIVAFRAETPEDLARQVGEWTVTSKHC